MAGRPHDNNHELAKLTGQLRYEAEHVHSKCGTFERYTKGGQCVACSLQRQRDMRAAHKALTTPIINIIVEDKPLDIGAAAALVEEDHYLEDLL
jgi:hypothetical protein